MVLGLPKAYRINTNVQSKIMLIMEIKFKQQLFTVQKRTICCDLEIANFWIEDYKHFPSSMLAIRSIIVVFVLFCWKTSKKFLLTFDRK